MWFVGRWGQDSSFEHPSFYGKEGPLPHIATKSEQKAETLQIDGSYAQFAKSLWPCPVVRGRKTLVRSDLQEQMILYVSRLWMQMGMHFKVLLEHSHFFRTKTLPKRSMWNLPPTQEGGLNMFGDILGCEYTFDGRHWSWHIWWIMDLSST